MQLELWTCCYCSIYVSLYDIRALYSQCTIGGLAEYLFSTPLCFFIHRSPRADWTSESTLTEPRLSSVYLWPDGTHRHQRCTRLSPSAPPASFNHFVQLIIAVIIFPDSLVFFVGGGFANPRLHLLCYLPSRELHFTCMISFISIHSGGFLPPGNCALITIIHTAEPAQVNSSQKVVMALFTIFSAF